MKKRKDKISMGLGMGIHRIHKQDYVIVAVIPLLISGKEQKNKSFFWYAKLNVVGSLRLFFKIEGG